MKTREQFDEELWDSRVENKDLPESEQTTLYVILLLVQIRESLLDIRDLLEERPK